MGYPKDGRKGYAAMCYINTIPHGQIDHRAVPRGEDPRPASSWQRYLAATGRGRDPDAARLRGLPMADCKRLLGG